MKSTFCCLALLVVYLAVIVTAQKSYTNKFDTVDVDSVLSNDRILTNYIRCLMEKGPCTPEGRELKKLLPDALKSECTKCTDVQKKNSQKVINFLRANRPGEWKLLLNKYDPSGDYRAKYEKQA
ncbi:ejaculatory bulb-specific protein 3 [Glossina fuscipes]|nr:ejaculatory bulb-specific protein 3 [Glossina fuscipes]